MNILFSNPSDLLTWIKSCCFSFFLNKFLWRSIILLFNYAYSQNNFIIYCFVKNKLKYMSCCSSQNIIEVIFRLVWCINMKLHTKRNHKLYDSDPKIQGHLKDFLIRVSRFKHFYACKNHPWITRYGEKMMKGHFICECFICKVQFST